MIRKATCDDIPAILALGKELHAKVGGLPEMDMNGCRQLLAQAIFHKRRLVLVAVKDGVITGFFFGMIEELFFSKSHYASDVAIYATDGMSGALMIRRFIRWAKAMGVTQIQLGVSSGLNIDRTDTLYQKLGLKRVGALYQGTL